MAPRVQVSAACDNGKYDCPTPPILFRPTMMFQIRSFTFPLVNKSLTHLEYYWEVLYLDGSPDNSGESCVIALAGSTSKQLPLHPNNP